MLPSDIYLADDLYDALVAGLTGVLRFRQSFDPRDVRRATLTRHMLIAHMTAAGLDLGAINHAGDVPVPGRYGELLDALAALDGCPCSGEIEPYQITDALGEHGNCWPDCVLADRAAEAA